MAAGDGLRGKAAKAGGAALPKDTLEQLESLGYVGGGGSGAAASGSDLKREDPKDFVAVFEHCKAGMELMWTAALRGGQERASSGGPHAPTASWRHLFLGEVEMTQLHAADAVREFSTALSILAQSKARPPPGRAMRNADRQWLVTRLGRALKLDGKPDEAIREYQTALQMDPVVFKDNSDLVNLLAARGRFAEAVAIAGRCRET